MQKIPVILKAKNSTSQEVEKTLKNKTDIKTDSYKKVSDNMNDNNSIHSSVKTKNHKIDSKKILTKEIRLLEQKLEQFITDNLLNSNDLDSKLLTNKLYKDTVKIDNPQATILNLHTQILLQPWSYTVTNNEIYFRILSILNSKENIYGSDDDDSSDDNLSEKDSHENWEENIPKKIKPPKPDSSDQLEGLAFIQWLSAISDENTNELNDFLNRMRIFQPLEFFQRVQNISANIHLFVQNNGTIKITNFHKDKAIIEKELNERGRLRTHIWAMVGFDYDKKGQTA